MKVTVIYGGRSGEHEISLISAAAIVRGLALENQVTLIGITKEGRWYLQPESELERIKKDTGASFKLFQDEKDEVFVRPAAGKSCFATKDRILETDVVFPALHGTYGEDGTIQGLLEMAEIPYVGCTTLSSSLTMDKEKTKVVVKDAGIPVVPYICIKRSELNDSALYDEIFQRAIDEIGFPLFVKPCCAGSSNGASKATNKKELSYALMEAFSWDDKVLVEKALNAREIECSVTGNSVTCSLDKDFESVKAYLPGEICPTHTFYDFDAKYNDPDGANLKVPAELSSDLIETVRSSAVKVYNALDAAGLSRVDFFIDKDDGKLYFNEINTMPGFTPISMFPKMCQVTGLSFDKLVALLLNEALSRFNAKERLQTSR